MEWTGRQQILLVWQSTILGLLLGILFDVFNGVGRISKRSARVWADIVWGPISALIVFFGSLFITNGQLHPVLLIGVLVGMLFEHYTVGIWLSRIVALCCIFLKKSIRRGIRIGYRIMRFMAQLVACTLSFVKKDEKNTKKA